MVISLASRSASRMISSNDLRRTSARSRGFLPAQSSNASLAASTAALASSTVALATEAILFSVAGSRTSKRPPSEDLRHLPPIHRSVGTLASKLSYLELMGGPHNLYIVTRGLDPRIHLLTKMRWIAGSSPAITSTTYPLSSRLHRAAHAIDDPVDRGQRDVFQYVGGRQRNVRRRDPYRRPVEVVERLIRHDRHDLGAPTAQPRVLLDREQAVRARYRAEDGPRVERHKRPHVDNFAVDPVFRLEL